MPVHRLPRNPHRVLTTGDIARLRQVSRVAAWKLLTRWEKKYGAEHVRRQHGTGRFAITVASYHHVMAHEAANTTRLYEEMRRLRDVLDEQTTRLNGLQIRVGGHDRRLESIEGRIESQRSLSDVNRR
jgi:hypothetical protein